MTAPLTRLRPGTKPRLIDGQQPLFPVLCKPCGAEWLRWLDYRTPRRRGPAGTVDVLFRAAPIWSETAAGREWLRQKRADDTAALIRDQQAHIRRLCAEGNHVPARSREGT